MKSSNTNSFACKCTHLNVLHLDVFDYVISNTNDGRVMHNIILQNVEFKDN